MECSKNMVFAAICGENDEMRIAVARIRIQDHDAMLLLL